MRRSPVCGAYDAEIDSLFLQHKTLLAMKNSAARQPDSQLTSRALLVPSSSLRPKKSIYSPFAGRRRLMKTASMTDEQPSHDWEGGDGPVDSDRA